MHLSDGEIKALLDQELTAETTERAKNHLEICQRCEKRYKLLYSSSQIVQNRLSVLNPMDQPGPLPARVAREDLSTRIQDQEVNNMSNKLFSKQARPAWIALGVILILAVSMTFAPIRAIANNFLGLFRVEKFTVVQVNPGDLPEQLGSSSQFEHMLTQNINFVEGGMPYSVPDKEAASSEVDFDVRLPVGMNKPLSSIMIQPGGLAEFTVDSALLQAVLAEIGRTDIEIPEGVDGATATLDIQSGVAAQYGDCEFDAEKLVEEGHDPDNPSVPQLPNCVTLVQGPSPTISAPPDLNLIEIGEAYLQLLGMNPEEAESFARKVDWTSTFVFPMPMGGTAFEEVPVDGVTGILILQALEGHQSQFMLMWVKDEITYVLTGPGSAATAANIARSLR